MDLIWVLERDKERLVVVDSSWYKGSWSNATCDVSVFEVEEIPLQYTNPVGTYDWSSALCKKYHSLLCQHTIPFWQTATGSKEILRQLGYLAHVDIPTMQTQSTILMTLLYFDFLNALAAISVYDGSARSWVVCPQLERVRKMTGIEIKLSKAGQMLMDACTLTSMTVRTCIMVSIKNF